MAKKPNVKPLDIEITFEEEKILNNNPVSKTDKEGNIIFISPSYKKIIKYSKEELIGKPHNIVRHPEMPELIFKEMWDKLLNGKTWKGYIKNLRKDGKYYWALVEIIPLDKNGELRLYGIDNLDNITGYISISKPPENLRELNKIKKYYKEVRKAELYAKGNKLEEWEKEILEKLKNN